MEEQGARSLILVASGKSIVVRSVELLSLRLVRWCVLVGQMRLSQFQKELVYCA